MRTIDDILKMSGRTLCSIAPETSVKWAIQLMADMQEASLPVFESGQMVGIISEKDCLKKVILQGKSMDDIRVREIMVKNIAFTTSVQTAEDCLGVMIEQQVQHLPVMKDGSSAGIVSMTELFRTIIDDQKEYIYRLENYVMGIDFGK